MSDPTVTLNSRLWQSSALPCNENGFSDIRRFFCLFVTFDLLFTFLLWLICLVLASDHSLLCVMEQQILQYNVQSSIVDIVLLAASRFIILLLVYGLICLDHYWPLTITTIASSAFLVTKVFLYKWGTTEANSTFTVVLVLCSFVLAWSELWLFDSRVVRHKHQITSIANLHSDERTDLLRRTASITDDVASSFYSPVGTPSDSENEVDSNSYYYTKAKEILEIATKELNSNGWKVEKPSVENTVIYSKHTKGGRKIYKLIADIPASPSLAFNELCLCCERIPDWNPSILDCKILERIDEHTDIIYHVAAENGGGLVSSRDFVDLRHWRSMGNDFISTSVSVTHIKMPPQKTYVRGENGVCALLIQHIPEDSNACRLHWLLNTDLKGWLPQYLIDQTFASVMMEFVGLVRNRIVLLTNQNAV